MRSSAVLGPSQDNLDTGEDQQSAPEFVKPAPHFACALPRFVSHVRQMFIAQELRHLSRIGRERVELDSMPIEEDDPHSCFVVNARRALHMTVPALGIS